MSETISQLPLASEANASDLIPATQGSTGAGTGMTRAITVAQIGTMVVADTLSTTVTSPQTVASAVTMAGALTISASGTGLEVENNAQVNGNLFVQGGTLTAPFFATPGNTVTLSGSTIPAHQANLGANWAGTSTVTGFTAIANTAIGAGGDNATISSGGRSELLIASNYGGTAFDGGRVGLDVQQVWNTASTVSLPGAGLTGMATLATSTVNAGGVTSGFGTTQFGLGVLFGNNPWARLATGGTFFNGVVGQEVDASIQTGASSNRFAIQQLVLTSDHATHGTLVDTGLAIGAQVGASVGLRNLIVLGEYSGNSPIDGNGYVLQMQTAENGPQSGAGGIDLLQFTASGSGPEGGGFTFRSSGPTGVGATAIDNVGGLKVGAGYISASAAGITLDTPLWVLSGTPTVVSGGTNFISNDVVVDGLGNVLQVTATTGVVSTVTVLRRSEGRASNPSGTVSCTARTRTGATLGSGLTVSETWAQNSHIFASNPSGDTITGKGSAGATTDTTGHLMIPFCAGAPTGVPTNASDGIAIRYDTTNHKLWCYDNSASAWKGVVLT